MYKAALRPGLDARGRRSLADFAAELGVSPITLAVAWVAKNPAITAPIISARSVEQLQPSLDAMTFDDGRRAL